MLLLIQYTLIFASVLLLVALGGCISEHSGVINLGLEGIMVVGALGGALVMSSLATASPLVMVLVARRETKAFLFIEVGANLLFAVGSFVGIWLFEMQGPMLAYALENFVTLVALAITVGRLKWNTP